MRRIFQTGSEGLPQPLAAEFTKKWADYCGVRYALLLPHGTDALRIALAAALDHDGLEYGGEVIVPNYTFIASANAALDRRCGVALVDVDPQTLNLDPGRVEEAIIPGKTKAIMAVHQFGQPADMEALRGIARKQGLALIEDAAQAHGGLHTLGRTGALGDAAGFSFQSSKNLCSGEGGAFTTDDPDIFERAYGLHNVGRARVGGVRWEHETVGWNCRATEYVAAVLLHRLRTFEAEQQIRHARFQSLRQKLGGVTCVEPLGTGPGVVRHAVFMTALRYRPEQCGGLDIEEFLRLLRAEGLPASRAYDLTLAQQPAFRKLAQKRPDYLRVLPTPVADQAVKEVIFLPHSVFLGTEADMDEIAAAFRKVQAHHAPRSSAPAGAAPAPQPPSPRATAGARRMRIGIVGAGMRGRHHAEAIAADPRLALTAVSDTRPEAAREMAGQFGCQAFDAPEELIRSGVVDALVIATPHWQHADLAVAAFRAGLHVLCEKPLTVTVGQADEVLASAAESTGLFAVVYPFRFEPAFAEAKRLLDSGQLGPVYRCSMVEAAWRTAAYFKSSPWRGTWKGEGGGVLLNQAPHVLDRYVWLCGMPEVVTARCDTNLHSIEVEDTVSAILRHANGAHGHLHLNTVESPITSRTVVSCDRGRVVIENNRLWVTRLRQSIREATAIDPRFWGEVEGETREIALRPGPNPLTTFYKNFLQAAGGKGQLVSPGEEGRHAVELANAMLLSSSRAAPVTLPLDALEYSQFMAEKLNSEPTLAS
jgi:dTDP-4-amino-4,6-dideoxygalactose transaminase/predicted dehydrogenase